jgi:hypothetical protein
LFQRSDYTASIFVPSIELKRADYHPYTKLDIIMRMGFPAWTLWGMAISALGALLALILALLAQSPNMLKRIGLSGVRLDLRVRAFTGYALALLLLAIGFFLAGVPLGPRPDLSSVTVPTPAIAEGQPSDSMGSDADIEDSEISVPVPEVSPPTTPETGSFGGPPTVITTSPVNITDTTLESEAPDTESLEQAATAVSVQPTPTASPSPTASATSTETPTSTATQTPTSTPTAIVGKTAVISIGGGNTWLLRSPGGQNLELIGNGDTVILLPGHGNEAGILWQEISTVRGVTGWIQEELLEMQN